MVYCIHELYRNVDTNMNTKNSPSSFPEDGENISKNPVSADSEDIPLKIEDTTNAQIKKVLAAKESYISPYDEQYTFLSNASGKLKNAVISEKKQSDVLVELYGISDEMKKELSQRRAELMQDKEDLKLELKPGNVSKKYHMLNGRIGSNERWLQAHDTLEIIVNICDNALEEAYLYLQMYLGRSLYEIDTRMTAYERNKLYELESQISKTRVQYFENLLSKERREKLFQIFNTVEEVIRNEGKSRMPLPMDQEKKNGTEGKNMIFGHIDDLIARGKLEIGVDIPQLAKNIKSLF